jgi:hypothetical protein
MKIGRYEIKFGSRCWIQTTKPTMVRCLLGFIWIFREAKPDDIDRKPQFPLGTCLESEGRSFRYYRATKNLHPGKVIVRLEPSRRLSEILGFPYYIERSFAVEELLKKGIIDEADVSRMEAGEEIKKQIPISEEEDHA